MGPVHILGGDAMGTGLLESARSAGLAVTLPTAAIPPISPDEVIQVMARTLADELAQPLTLRIGTRELWQAGYYADEPPAAIWARLELASQELARRFAQ